MTGPAARAGTLIDCRPHPSWRAAALGMAMALGLGGPALAQVAGTSDSVTKIDVRAAPIPGFDTRDPALLRFGALHFRGGLQLSSTDRNFGGFSAIRVSTDGARFIAVSDRGRWWRGRIVYDGERPVGIADAEMAPILGPDGKPARSRRWYDAESIAEDDGTLYVGIERANEILRFDYAKRNLSARGEPIAVPSGIKKLVNNRGIECLAMVSKGQPLAGSLIAVSELTLDESGNHVAFLIGGPKPGPFAIKHTDDYSVSDCAFLPAGDLLMLERRLSLLRGGAIRIRRIAQSAIAPGAVVDGPVLIEADLGYQIDNMEGLSVHRDARGEIVLTLISDDNFSLLQRTLLLQFTLIEP
jgi:hypothetical protein